MKIMKLFTISLLIIITSLSYGQKSTTDFVMTWEGQDSVVHIPVSSSHTYNYDIDWDDDGVFDDFGVTDSISHKYNYVGIYLGMFNRYTIRIRGVFPSIKFEHKRNNSKVLFVHQWGDILIKDFTEAFKNSSDLEISATDAPNFDTTLNISCEDAFKGIILFNGLLDHWGMSSVTNMRGMFEGSSAFSSPINFNSWDVSNVTNMKNMFKNCANLQTDLHSWDVSSVTDMSGMFDGADNVIGDISSWDVSSVTDMSKMFRGIDNFINYNNNIIDLSNWNVSSVIVMTDMFSNLGRDTLTSLKRWDVSSVTDMKGMFAYARTFNQNLGGWDISSVTDMTDMLNSFTNWGANPPVMSIENYDSTLIGWAQNTHNMNVELGAENLEYCIAINERNQLISNGWIVTGDTTICITSIEEEVLETVSIYPNPTSGTINLKNLDFKEEIEIYSKEGKLVKSQRILNNQIDLEGLEDGVYFLKVGESFRRVVIIN